MIRKNNKKYLEKFISSQYLEEDTIRKYKYQFDNEKYVKHCVFTDFLRSDYIEKILQEVRKGKYEYDEFYTNQKGYKKGTGAYVSWKYLWKLYTMFHSKAFYEYMQLFYENEVYTPINFWFFLENILRSITRNRGCLLQIYNNDDYLSWHTDGPVDKVAGSFVFFLTPEWEKSQGGALELWYKDSLEDSDAVCYKAIYPCLNTFVFFKCEKDISWHRVNKVISGKRITYHDQLFHK